MKAKEDPPEKLKSKGDDRLDDGDDEKMIPPHHRPAAGLQPATESTLLALQPPPFQTVMRGDDEEKVCRICLEDDHPNTMISPCKCKGGSKWVHRECLDEWRTNERDRAFSKCTECLFQYHMQPIKQHRVMWKRKAKFYIMVSRDVCVVTILLQLVIAGLGGLVYLFDQSQQSIPQLINNGQHPIAAYYLFGWLIFLVLLGFYGSCTLCQNGCSPTEAVGSISQLAEPDENATYGNRSSEYRRRRRHRRTNDCCHDYCYGPPYYYYGDPSGCCCCCDGNNGGHDDCCGGGDCCNGCGGGSGGGGGDGSAESCLVVFLIVVAVIMAVIGFLVGLVITVVVFQRIVQRHVYLLHKRQLAKEFQVQDLSGYDLSQPLNPLDSYTPPPPAETDLQQQQHPNPSAPPSCMDLEEQRQKEPEIKVDSSTPANAKLQEKDAAYLKMLGLME